MVAANDTMAGDDDVDAISANGLSHCSDTFRIAYCLGNLHIASCLTVRDFEQCPPYLKLKSRSDRMQRNTEIHSIACKILIELFLRLLKNRGRLYPEISIHIPF